MSTKLRTSVILGLILSFVLVGAAAQQSQKGNEDKRTESTPGMMGGGMMGQGQGMMNGGIMGMMGQMQAHHQQMTELMKQLVDSMAAIRNEKDPAKLKTEMEEHQKLLDQMRSQMMGQGNRMNMMSGQIDSACPGAGSAGASSKP